MAGKTQRWAGAIKQAAGSVARRVGAAARRAGTALRRFDRDEAGAEGLEKLLILAAIALPLLGLLIWFKDDLVQWVKDVWGVERERSNQKAYEDGSYGSQ